MNQLKTGRILSQELIVQIWQRMLNFLEKPDFIVVTHVTIYYFDGLIFLNCEFVEREAFRAAQSSAEDVD